MKTFIRKRSFKLMTLYSLLFISVFFIAFCIFITVNGLHDTATECDAIVVLGNTVNPDGTPSARLSSRLDKAKELYRSGFSSHIIVSGATGKEGVDEAVAMKRYLMSFDIPDTVIIVDSTGFDTYQSATNAKKICEENGFHSVTVVSQFFHISRTKLAFYKVGFKKVYSAHAEYFELRDLYSICREFFAYLKYMSL